MLAVLAGLAGLLWAMRDRFISITAPKEAEPPAFRVPPSTPAISRASDDLTLIGGVGPVYAGRLRAAGITTFASMASSSADRLAAATGVPLGKAAGWIEQAAALRSP